MQQDAEAQTAAMRSAIEARFGPEAVSVDRLLQAAGTELVPAPPEQAALLRRSRRLQDVLGLAEALPFRRTGGLRYPRVPS